MLSVSVCLNGCQCTSYATAALHHNVTEPNYITNHAGRDWRHALRCVCTSPAERLEALQEERVPRWVLLHKVGQRHVPLLAEVALEQSAHVVGERRAEEPLLELLPVDVREELTAASRGMRTRSARGGSYIWEPRPTRAPHAPHALARAHVQATPRARDVTNGGASVVWVRRPRGHCFLSASAS